jgi:phosphatidylglycerol---prolipoprotein diacylglyceryl transferase
LSVYFSMIPYSPHPILFEIGPLAIRYYSLAYIIGFVCAYYALKKSFGKEKAEDLLFWLVLATIAGGRIGEFIFYSPSTFWTRPWEILFIWHGGMSFHGALIALIGTLYWYCKKHKLSFATTADVLVVPALIGNTLGRVANWLNGELVGIKTNVSWCMEFPDFSGCRHPSQLYEAFYSLVLLGIIYWQLKKQVRVKSQPGFIFALFIMLYGLLRFAFNFLRDDSRWLGISTGQILSLIMFAVGVYLLATKYKNSVSKIFS